MTKYHSNDCQVRVIFDLREDLTSLLETNFGELALRASVSGIVDKIDEHLRTMRAVMAARQKAIDELTT
jgi:hypothetical protein